MLNASYTANTHKLCSNDRLVIWLAQPRWRHRKFPAGNFRVSWISSCYSNLSSRWQIRRGYVTAKYKTHAKVVVFWNLWMSFEKEKKDCVFFLSSNSRPKKGGKHAAVNRLRAQRFFLQRRMATRNRRSWTQIEYEWKAVGWKEFTEVVLNLVGGSRRSTYSTSPVSAVRCVSYWSRTLSCLWHLYKPSYN